MGTFEPPSLRSLQTSMMALIRAPDGVRVALAGDERHAWLLNHSVGNARASAVERLEIYADMYFYRLLDSLRLDYPKLAAAVGEMTFHNLITDYLLVCPSRDPSVRVLGRDLPQFLQNHALGQQRPYLTDLAALEWARIDVFDRHDQPLLTLADLAQQARDGFSALRLQIIDAHAIVRLGCDVAETWRQLHTGSAVDVPPACPQTLLVWRQPDLFVYHRPLEASEAACLAHVQGGVTFVDLCTRLAADRSPVAAAERALSLLAAWTTAGLLRANGPASS